MQITNCKFSISGFGTCRFNFQFVVVFTAITLVVLTANGCKKSSRTASVHGRVSLRGEPLQRGALTFFPAGGRPVASAISGGAYKTGLTPGEYTIVVSIAPELPTGYKEGDPTPPPKVVLPGEYSTRAKSTLKATVKAGQEKPIDFVLK
jgi:hypothetical protein